MMISPTATVIASVVVCMAGLTCGLAGSSFALVSGPLLINSSCRSRRSWLPMFHFSPIYPIPLY